MTLGWSLILGAAAALYLGWANRAKLPGLISKGLASVGGKSVSPVAGDERATLDALLTLRPVIASRANTAEIDALNTLLKALVEVPTGLPQKGGVA